MRYSVPESFRDADGAALAPELVEQIKLCALLGYGLALSLLVTGGLASLAAFPLGWEARRRIRRSAGRLVGLRLAWWCIIFGGLGALAAPASITLELSRHQPISNLKKAGGETERR